MTKFMRTTRSTSKANYPTWFNLSDRSSVLYLDLFCCLKYDAFTSFPKDHNRLQVANLRINYIWKEYFRRQITQYIQTSLEYFLNRLYCTRPPPPRKFIVEVMFPC